MSGNKNTKVSSEQYAQEVSASFIAFQNHGDAPRRLPRDAAAQKIYRQAIYSAANDIVFDQLRQKEAGMGSRSAGEIEAAYLRYYGDIQHPSQTGELVSRMREKQYSIDKRGQTVVGPVSNGFVVTAGNLAEFAEATAYARAVARTYDALRTGKRAGKEAYTLETPAQMKEQLAAHYGDAALKNGFEYNEYTSAPEFTVLHQLKQTRIPTQPAAASVAQTPEARQPKSPAARPQAAAAEYIIKEGDSLSRIVMSRPEYMQAGRAALNLPADSRQDKIVARQLAIKLAELNGINDANRIEAGQKIILPTARTLLAVKPGAKAAALSDAMLEQEAKPTRMIAALPTQEQVNSSLAALKAQGERQMSAAPVEVDAPLPTDVKPRAARAISRTA